MSRIGELLSAYHRHPYLCNRETKRSGEIQELIEQGKVPHEVELERHPEKSIQGLSCKPFNQTYSIVCSYTIVGLMGRVAGSIKDIKPAKEMSALPTLFSHRN